MPELPTNATICKDVPTFLSSPFDYLIIGGGTAGLVLAARLSENPNVRVGVLEAGKLRLGDSNVESMGGVSAMLHNPDYDWVFKSVPQEGINGRVLHVARGKLLGGSSAINFMAYVRPAAADIDAWNVKGWSWADLEKYFHKSETVDLPSSYPEENFLDPASHGKAGPIHTSLATWTAPIEDDLLRAFADKTGMPFPLTVDPWSGTHLGFYPGLSTVDRSQAGKVTRSYAATGYLAPILERENLKILTDASVFRILLEKEETAQGTEHSLHATGVEFQHGGSHYKALANHEVILSTSTIQTPRLLELSGIGNSDIIAKAGIECVLNLPSVGENMQDHPMTSVTFELTPGENNDNITIDSVFHDPELFAEQQKLLLEKQEGMFANPLAMSGYLPYATQVSSDTLKETIRSIQAHSKQTDTFQQSQEKFIIDQLSDPSCGVIQLLGIPAGFDIVAGAGNQGLTMLPPPPGRKARYAVLISTMYPLSRGSSHITSASESLESSPNIDIGLLSHPADLDVLAAAVAFVDRVLSPSPLQSSHVKTKIAGRADPGPEVNLQDPSQAKEFIRDRTMIFNHILGTCAMGQVVDERLRVKGVAGLRIVDASIIPTQVGGNIVSTVYAIAEKAADMIKDDYSSVAK